MITALVSTGPDWRLLPTSLASYIDHVDGVVVGIDSHRLGWDGKPFDLDRGELEAALATVDPDGKVCVVEWSYYRPELTPLEMDTAKREHLASLAPVGAVLLEIDSDEIVLDPLTLAFEAEDLPTGYQLVVPWINVFKVVLDTALVVDDNTHHAPAATRSRTRKNCRVTGEPVWPSSTQLEHLTLGRSEGDVEAKLRSWAHAPQMRRGYFEFWRSVNLQNYQDTTNLHPFRGPTWPSLKAVPLSSIRWGAFLRGEVR